jgi:hypothetical protein
MYTLQGKIQSTRYICFPRQSTYARRTLPTAVLIRVNLSRVVDRFGQIPLLLRKRAPDIIHITSADRSVGLYPVSLPSQPMKLDLSQASIDDKVLGLLGPYQHAIGMFNTCSRGPTHRSLTDTGGGYNLGRYQLSTYHSPTCPTSCLSFPPKGLVRSQVIIQLIII